MGLYEIENIGNPNICTITINLKEYFEELIKNIKALEETLHSIKSVEQATMRKYILNSKLL